MTATRSKIEIVRHIAFMLVIVLLACNFGFGWFRNRVYKGGNMQYTKVLHIGGRKASIANYVGVKNEEGGIEYIPLYLTDGEGNAVMTGTGDELSYTYSYANCEELTSLLPGERQYFYTEITNLCNGEDGAEPSELYISLFLDDVFYSSILDQYLYFAVTSPEVSMTNYYGSATFRTDVLYTGSANVEEGSCFSNIGSVPLVRHQTIQAGDTLRVYWYMYLDTDAGNECIGSTVIFEALRLSFNS